MNCYSLHSMRKFQRSKCSRVSEIYFNLSPILIVHYYMFSGLWNIYFIACYQASVNLIKQYLNPVLLNSLIVWCPTICLINKPACTTNWVVNFQDISILGIFSDSILRAKSGIGLMHSLLLLQCINWRFWNLMCSILTHSKEHTKYFRHSKFIWNAVHFICP